MNVIWLYRVVWCYGIQLKIYGGPDVPEQTSNVEGYEARVGNSCDLTWDFPGVKAGLVGSPGEKGAGGCKTEC